MLQYKAYDENVGQAAFQKFLKDTSYLTEENVVFAWFNCNEDSCIKIKQEFGNQLCLMPHADEFQQGIPIVRQRIDQNTAVVDLVGPESWFIFKTLSVNHD